MTGCRGVSRALFIGQHRQAGTTPRARSGWTIRCSRPSHATCDGVSKRPKSCFRRSNVLPGLLTAPPATPLIQPELVVLWKIVVALSVLLNGLLVYWLLFLPR